MNKTFLKLVLGGALLAGVSAPAAAQSYYDRDRYGRYDRDYDRDGYYDRDDWRYERRGYGHGRGVDFDRQIERDPALRRAAFRWFDRDRDGRLERWERDRAERAFYRIADRNGDGRVGWREYELVRERLGRGGWGDYAYRR